MPDERMTLRAAMLAAAAMIAQQVAGKAVRDALFLSNFPVTALPAMIAVASLLAVAAALAMTRLLSARGPARAIPVMFAASAALMIAEWALATVSPRAGAIAVFLHMAILGPVLVSGFWTLTSERFDPRTARRTFGRIAAWGTLGGVLGGVAGERMAAAFGVAGALPLLAALHLVCAAALAAAGTRSTTAAGAEALGLAQGFRVLGSISYLRRLVWLVLFVTTTAALVDYVFKTRAVEAASSGPALMQVFTVFYIGVSMITFAVQSLATTRMLERFGVGGTIASLPAVVAVGGAGALLVPGLGSAALARGCEAVLRNSLYRSGYEVLYTPVPVAEKRATKQLVDVGVERLGDAVGAGVISLALALGLGSSRVLLGLAVGMALLTLWLTTRLHRGYVASLEHSLVRGAAEIDALEPLDRTTRTILMRSLSALDQTQVIRRSMLDDVGVPDAVAKAGGAVVTQVPASDHVESVLADLGSADPTRVRHALAEVSREDARVVARVIELLGWDEVAHDAVQALRGVAARHLEVLTAALLDRDRDFAVRRRVPRVLAVVPTWRSFETLIEGLSDPRFEVRYQCGRALAYILEHATSLRVEPETVMRSVRREVSVGRPVWESQYLLDRLEDDATSMFLDEVLRERSSRSLEHVFTLLALVHPREPLRVAFRGLHTDDPMLRGTALEYLESLLPADVWEPLRVILDDERPRRPSRRPQAEVVDELMASNPSIEVWLAELQRRGGEAEKGGSE